MDRIILASASPRRRELLEQAGFHFEVVPSTCEETITGTEPGAVVEELSRQKAIDVCHRVKEQDGFVSEQETFLIIGADTIVVHEGTIMGKPKDQEDARRMLALLQGKTHEVYTGVTLCERKRGKEFVRTFHESTKVTFYPLEDHEIQAYVETGEPMDKAGSYGIQGRGVLLVERIDGDYNNVVGLPLARLNREIKKMERGNQ